MQRFLKIKIKSLAAESKIIRAEERKVLGFARELSSESNQVYRDEHLETYVGLRRHRTTIVRDEARVSFLAYAFLRGHPPTDVERSRPPEYLVKRAASIVHRFGSGLAAKATEDQMSIWLDSLN